MSAPEHSFGTELLRIEQSSPRFSEAQFASEIAKIRDQFQAAGRPILPEIEWERAAFDFHEDYDKSRGGWGLYYGPMLGLKNEEGGWDEYPSIAKLTPDVLRYWAGRAQITHHPLLKCRYADLCWEFAPRITGTKRDITWATAVVDSTVLAADESLFDHAISGKTALGRALSVALQIGDQTRILSVRDCILRYEDKIARDEYSGLWGFSFDLILENPKVLITDEIEQKIIRDLDDRLGRLAVLPLTESGPSLGVEYAAIRLANYYQRKHIPDSVRRVLLAYGDHFVTASENARAMVGGAWLQRVCHNFMAFGLRDDADKLVVRLRALNKRSTAEMTTHTARTRITDDDWRAYISAMTEGGHEACLDRLAKDFVPDREKLVEQIKEQTKTAPLVSLMPITIVDYEGRPTAAIGNVENDLDGRVAHFMATNMAIGQIFLQGVIDAIRQAKGPSVDDLLVYLQRSPVFDSGHNQLLRAGLNFYLNGEIPAAVHLLIPRIEAALRRLLELGGGVIMKQHRNGGFILKNLEEVLRDEIVMRSLTENVALYLRVLLTDQRGWNLRNNVCHGLQPPETFTRAMADRVFHAILVLSRVRENPGP